MTNRLGGPFHTVNSFVKPGAKLSDILNIIDTSPINCNDIVVIIAGTNDVGHNSPFQFSLLKDIGKIHELTRKCKVIFCSFTTRHDRPTLNKDIDLANFLVFDHLVSKNLSNIVWLNLAN